MLVLVKVRIIAKRNLDTHDEKSTDPVEYPCSNGI